MNDPYAALRYPEFRRLVTATFLLTAAILVQEVALGYEIYLLTRDPLKLGLVGLAEAIPFIALALFGGHLADRRDRLGLMRGGMAAILAGSTLLMVLMYAPVRAHLTLDFQLAAIYGTISLLGLARGIYSPAASSLKPFLVPRELYPNSSAWISSFWQAGAVLGPAIAGFSYAAFGITATLGLVVVALATTLWLIAGIARRPPPPRDTPHDDLWTSLREGLDYVRKTKAILYAISLDMVSVFFGGVVAILPVYAADADLLNVGAQGLGVLRASPAVGATLVMIICAYYPPTERAWRNLLWSVAGFGVVTLVFAVSKSFWLSIGMLFLTGAFDSISVIIRQTLMQALPPEHLRGRAVAVNSIFVSASNELGAFESGLAARLMGVVPSVLFGGAMTLLTVGAIWRRSRELLVTKLL